MSQDWFRFMKKRKMDITRKPPKKYSQTTYFLGGLVKVGTQVYRSFAVSKILLRVIFGVK